MFFKWLQFVKSIFKVGLLNFILKVQQLGKIKNWSCFQKFFKTWRKFPDLKEKSEQFSYSFIYLFFLFIESLMKLSQEVGTRIFTVNF